MPAKAGIQVRFRFEHEGPGFPPARERRKAVDFQSTNVGPLGLEPRVIQLTTREGFLFRGRENLQKKVGWLPK